MVMPRLPKSKTLARVAPWANVGLLLLAVVVTALLAYRAHQAASAHRSTAEQALREYAAFAAFELKNATLNTVNIQQRLATGPLMRGFMAHPKSPLEPNEVAELVQRQASVCRCLGGARFYYSVTLADSTISATPAPLATSQALRWFRDTIITHANDASRRADRIAPPGPGVKYPPPGTPMMPTQLVPISTRIDGQSVIFVPVMIVDVYGKPLTVYGFATDPVPYVGEAVRHVLQSQRLLPAALTRGVPIDSILAMRVLDHYGNLIYQNSSPFDSRYAALDSLEARQGGLRFNIAISPAMADRLIIGGVPRSNLASLIGLFALSAGLLVLLLYQLHRQQELVRLRSEFVSGVSHELRTPLAQIRVLAELLRLGKIPTEERRERSLRIIDQEARRLSFLVESILTFSALERDKVVPTRTDVAAEIDEIVTGFEPLASVHGVRVETSLERGLVANVDRAAMRQMLLNLLDNAVRYGPDGQTVKVMTESQNGTWRLIVEDQGKGIPASERERIFEPYYRMNRDARGEKGGSGIGLAVVRGLVEKHGGRVTVGEPTTGGGARFSLELPVAGPSTVGDQ
jgi:signal transduction histidine kinase